MTKLYIREWAGIAGEKQAPTGFIRDQVVDYTSGAAASALPFHQDTTLLEWSNDSICSWVIGTSPTATTSNMRYPADSHGFVCVSAGNKISAITNT
jgi:hypothetical protein